MNNTIMYDQMIEYNHYGEIKISKVKHIVVDIATDEISFRLDNGWTIPSALVIRDVPAYEIIFHKLSK